MHHSITPEQVADNVHDWPGERYILREVNGSYGQHWAVCDAKTWAIYSLSYTKEEASAILNLFQQKGLPS